MKKVGLKESLFRFGVAAVLVFLVYLITGHRTPEASPTPLPTVLLPPPLTSTATASPTATYAPIESAPTWTPTATATATPMPPTSTPTMAPTKTPTPIPTATPETCLIRSGTIYTIQPGDTLWHISECAYGDPQYWPAIFVANPQLSSPDLIHAGNPLFIPSWNWR